MSKDSVKVSICMISYNHEHYIREAINGVLMQRCNFLFELVIGEDCSLDNTRSICEKFARQNKNINLLPSNKNLGVLPNFNRTLSACSGKYIALCEGDDYWTDPYKLQKQVDFMETNPDYSLICSNYYKKRDSKKISVTIPSKIDYTNLLVGSNKIPTLSTLFRNNHYISYNNDINPLDKNWKAGDYPLWLYLSTKGRIKVLDDFTGVYRVLQSSASHFQDIDKQYQFFENMISIREFFHNKYSSDNVEITQKLRIRKINLEMYKWFNKSSVKQYYKVLQQKHQLEKKYHLTDIIKLLVLATGLMFVYKLRKNLLIK